MILCFPCWQNWLKECLSIPIPRPPLLTASFVLKQLFVSLERHCSRFETTLPNACFKMVTLCGLPAMKVTKGSWHYEALSGEFKKWQAGLKQGTLTSTWHPTSQLHEPLTQAQVWGRGLWRIRQKAPICQLEWQCTAIQNKWAAYCIRSSTEHACRAWCLFTLTPFHIILAVF